MHRTVSTTDWCQCAKKTDLAFPAILHISGKVIFCTDFVQIMSGMRILTGSIALGGLTYAIWIVFSPGEERKKEILKVAY